MLGHDYTLSDRLLHRLALGIPAVAELSFDLDQRATRAEPGESDHRHVFVTGLARAGTTVLLRHLRGSGPFRSLTYRDMPFVLAPSLWKRFSSRWQQGQAERMRAHGDRIMVNADSPEAFEEVFWRTFTGHDYIRPEGLLPYRPGKAALERFRGYVAAILASGGPGERRYLSKNNNNILRLPVLADAFPEARFVVPFRHPHTHATSLWKQHELFCRMQADSPFIRSYMDWLGHYEFGRGHRPFLFGGSSNGDLSPESPDYWLDLWIRTHEALMEQPVERRHWVCYEDLCTNGEVWAQLARLLGLTDPPKPNFALSRTSPMDFDRGKLGQAEAIYTRLRRAAGAAAEPVQAPG